MIKIQYKISIQWLKYSTILKIAFCCRISAVHLKTNAQATIIAHGIIESLRNDFFLFSVRIYRFYSVSKTHDFEGGGSMHWK